jgi:hypothetical protein
VQIFYSHTFFNCCNIAHSYGSNSFFFVATSPWHWLQFVIIWLIFLPSSTHTFVSIATEHSSDVWVAFCCNWLWHPLQLAHDTKWQFGSILPIFLIKSLTNTFMPVGTLHIYIVVIGLYLLLQLSHCKVIICFSNWLIFIVATVPLHKW